MSHIVVIRSYKPSDELKCREIAKDGIMSSLNTAFLGNVFREVTFEMMILCAALMFIFFGVPFTICIMVVPIVIILIYILTYASLVTKSMEVDQEISNIPRIYTSHAFCGFWVAEAFEPYLMTRNPKDVRYSIMTEKQFRESNVDVSSQTKKTVGMIALTKSRRVDKGAWIKRLAVDRHYQRKGIGTCLLNVAIQFAIDQRYGSVETVASEYTEGGRELCFNRGFELRQMYHKQIVGSLVTVLMYELTYQIKPLEREIVIPPKSHARSFMCS
ncbi:uncharacterized protein LOC124302018 [Neodiprion virginianus]|uniref:uncharacterized protein LOC124302018 n=1 Tax=Neodiprion virginianus TaxID=2961670 RepID=UPI001EE6EDF8|nr:uncharacterized protein LOC124302018 [Neodiprion virginianus]